MKSARYFAQLFYIVLFNLIFMSNISPGIEGSFKGIGNLEGSFLASVERVVQDQSWDKVVKYVILGVQRGIPLHSYYKIRNKLVHKSLDATKKLLKLKETGLTKEDAIRIGFFMETRFQEALNKYGFYLSKHITRTGRSIEHDPLTKKTFIHLGTNNISELGRGFEKNVTKSIMYGANPEIVARCVTTASIMREIEIMQALGNESGVQKIFAYTVRILPGEKKLISVFCRYYPQGNLQRFFDIGWKFTKNEKLNMALQMLKALENMHAKKIAHCDLSPRNFLAHAYRDKKTGKQKILVTMADFGRSNYIDKLKKRPQGNTTINPPEALLASVKGEGYLKADIFALGCLFWKLWYEERPIWCRSDFMRSTNPESSYNQFIALLKKNTINSAKYKMSRKNLKTSSQKFESLIYKMVHPYSENRANAQELRKELELIIRNK